jgi:regulation of enolase protein 1 (concanavalin A-like superfamily)
MCQLRQRAAVWFAAFLCVLLAVTPTDAAPKAGGPKPSWVTTAVGTVTVQGSATIARSGRITIYGEGTDIWSTADGFQYLYQRLSGDGAISAKITSLDNTDGWAKAGVMIRQGLTANSVHAALLTTPANGIVFEQRTTSGGLTTRMGVAGAAPSWLRVARMGASVTASVSSDGTTWVDVGTSDVPMSADVFVGLAVTSRYPSKLACASFERAAITVGSAIKPAGPVAAWSFDDGAGTLVRASIGGLDGTMTGASWTTAGRNAGALMFNGVDSLVTVPPNAALNLTTGMTVEAWVYPVTLTSWHNVAMKEGTTDLAYALYANDGSSTPKSVINAGAGHVETAGTAQLPSGVWSHLATTFDGSTQRLYLNGVLVGSAGAVGTLTQTTGVLRMGGNGLLGEWFDGAIDDMRIYNRALTPTEISTDMNTPVPPPPADTTLPNVAITAPVAGATVSGTVTVTAAATDNVGVASVQFLLNSVNFGPPVTTAPYTVAWNTQTVTNGSYKLTAVARDFAGNANVSADVTVSVNNAIVPNPGPLVTGRFVEFTSADHFATLSDGRAMVSGYVLEVWLPGSNTSTGQPYTTSNLGKPASSSTVITADERTFFGTLPKGQEFFTTVTASGPGGSARSGASNSFMMP